LTAHASSLSSEVSTAVVGAEIDGDDRVFKEALGGGPEDVGDCPSMADFELASTWDGETTEESCGPGWLEPGEEADACGVVDDNADGEGIDDEDDDDAEEDATDRVEKRARV
jgi:hypothetical protein